MYETESKKGVGARGCRRLDHLRGLIIAGALVRTKAKADSAGYIRTERLATGEIVAKISGRTNAIRGSSKAIKSAVNVYMK